MQSSTDTETIDMVVISTRGVDATSEVARHDNVARDVRPPYFTSAREMQVLIDEYFALADEKKWPYTIPDLALALGFLSRTSLLNYQGKPEFVSTIKRAKLRIEAQRVRQLVQGSGIVAGQIFDLKNNFWWRDQQEQIISGDGVGVVQHIGLVGFPPEPKNIEEWQTWYEAVIGGQTKPKAIEKQAAIDLVTTD